MNARGTPLTAADLIRNFVFQRLAAEGADTRAHLDDWPFETEFWEKEVSVGRYPLQRSSLFFNQWLSNRPLLFIGTLFVIVGVQLVLFGLLAEMITYSYRRESDYSIVETSESNDEMTIEPPPTSAGEARRGIRG